jgi:hypothetical protein
MAKTALDRLFDTRREDASAGGRPCVGDQQLAVWRSSDPGFEATTVRRRQLESSLELARP